MADAFGDYQKMVHRIPLLEPAEELHLASIVQAWQNNSDPAPHLVRRGRQAMKRMVTGNLRLVISACLQQQKRISGLYVDPMDVIQAGNLGLIRAVERFDPLRGYKFSTYGYWWIRQAINRYFQDQAPAIRIPADLVSLARKAAAIRSETDQRLQPGKIAEMLDTSEERLQMAIRARYEFNTLSLHQPLGSSSDSEFSLLDAIPGQSQTVIKDDYQWLISEVQQLEPFERQVIAHRYGSELRHSQAETANLMGLSRDKVQRLEKKALLKLRRKLAPALHPEPSRGR